MGNNLARQLIADHLFEGDMRPGEEIALRSISFFCMTVPVRCALSSSKLWASGRYPGIPLSPPDNLLRCRRWNQRASRILIPRFPDDF
jgi:hypothetical protein